MSRPKPTVRPSPGGGRSARASAKCYASSAEGATNREIATALGVGDETVKTLIGRSFSKLGVRRRAEAVAAAHKLGLL